MKTFKMLGFALLLLLSCSTTFGDKLKPANNNYSKVNISSTTEISELGITKFVAKSNPFWQINDQDIIPIEGNLSSIISTYLKNSGQSGKDSLFNTSIMYRQYAGLKGENNHYLILARFYKESKLKSHYGDHYADTLSISRGSYFHFYPNFYFLVYDQQDRKAIYMKW